MDPVLRLVLIAIISYLIGSFPTGVVVSKLVFGFDIREKGSGNMGSTNVFRVMGWKFGVFVQLFDLFKGIAAVLFAQYFFSGELLPFVNRTPFEDITVIKIIAGVSAVAGHIWSAFLGFKGGKGINTAAGMLVGIAPVDVGIALGFFLLALISSGYVSLSSITAAIVLPSSMFFRHNVLNVDIHGYGTLIYFMLALMALVLYTHRKNLQRLAEGTENKFPKLQLIKFGQKK